MKILVVEDEPGISSFLKQGLEEENFPTDIAEDGIKGLSLALTGNYDLLLLDWMLPGMTGLEITRQLKSDPQTSHIPIIIQTVKDSDADITLGLEMGADDYITKPFHAREVRARVATHLSLRALQSQLGLANKVLERQNAELQRRNAELHDALATIQSLSGLIPICAWCGRKIEDEDGRWVPVEVYIQAHSQAQFTHGMCPDCFDRMKEDAARALQNRSPLSPPEVP